MDLANIEKLVEKDILIVDEILGVGDFLFQRKCEAKINEILESLEELYIETHLINLAKDSEIEED